MGLKEMTPKQLKKSQDFLKMLEFFGVSEQELKKLADYLAEIETLKVRVSELEAELEANKQKRKIEEENKVNSYANIQEAVSAYMKPQQELNV